MKKITFLMSLLTTAFVFSQSSATYDISLTTIWNSAAHTSVPGNAHWSPLSGATHKNPNDILEFGAIAPTTDGIKDIAETGNTTNFNDEIDAIIAAGNSDQYLQQGFAPFAGNNSVSTLNDITVSEDFPLITLVSMVAPSPDWFVAVNNLDLRSGNNAVNNGWKDTFTLDVFAYDSGTDSGINYTTGDMPTEPREPISMVSGFPINGNRMGTITFTYKSSTLSTQTINSIENLKIFPNPSNGNITILNTNNMALKTIEIYSVLGKLVKQVSVTQNASSLNLDLSKFNKGIYLIKLLNANGISKVEKLLLN